MRRLAYQAAAIAVALIVVGYLVHNASVNLEERRIASGFAFLEREAGFEISESPFLRYGASDTYLSALLVGIGNTLRVAVIGVVAATLLGAAVGLFRLSKNFLLRTLCRGLRRVHPQLAAPGAALLLVRGHHRGAADAARGARSRCRACSSPIAACTSPLPGSVPVLEGFNFAGGFVLTPEFAALLVGLTVYTAAFIAEIVRAGVLAVGRGQWDAAFAIGLTRGQALRRVVVPQALRVMVPPMASQYLNITKNSSLAVAIGYPDLVSIANTTINQTGQAIEGVAIIMAVYLTISLSISAFMNWYNARIARR